ncbi:hypothetical protein ABT124_41850 [Streptomyces sp. NPDC001982]|uniref:hypothetical protein n=1 Tax=Streptomyces sp. NPDC001982 TaxID=3154405 RepID=UPI00332318C5
MRKKRIIASTLLAACSALGITMASSSAASANTAYGCGYPQVCFYKTQADWNARSWTAAYKDVTSYYQTLGSRSYGSYSVFNSRNDDGALLHYTNGGTYCVGPNSIVYNNSWVVDKIRIMDSPSCAY